MDQSTNLTELQEDMVHGRQTYARKDANGGASDAPTSDTHAANDSFNWNAAYDPATRAWYYYNLATGERTWEPPPDWVPNEEAIAHGSVQHHPQAEETTGCASKPRESHGVPTEPLGYSYIDAHGISQGPFSKEQLLAWREVLPMDLLVWGVNKCSPEQMRYLDMPHTSVVQHSEHGEPSVSEIPPEDSTTRTPTIPLAEVLGDGALLTRWREEHPEEARFTCAAPPAGLYERGAEEPDTFTTLAQAALAGLPPTDDAVKMAQTAAVMGQSLKEAVEWSRNQSEYTATALHTAGRGRVQAVGEVRESIYSEMGSWMDPRSVEEQMRKAKERGKRALTQAEVRAVRQRKLELKQKKTRAWLMQ